MGHRTDYTPRAVIDERYTQAVRRGDQKWILPHPVVVKFDSSFDEFAARVAYELRSKILYRTDGGRNARGLVRTTGDLQAIHSIYATAKPPTRDGTPISLQAIFERRQDRQANMRWVMAIRFNDSNGITFVDETDAIVMDVNVGTRTRQLVEAVIDHAHSIAQKLQGDRGKHIRTMVKIAEDAGYPRNWDLWIYSSEAVFSYMDKDIKKADEETDPNSPRRRMTAATGGKFPFDGDTGFPKHIPWRIFPFRNAAQKCFAKPSLDDCEAPIQNELKRTEQEMDSTFDAIKQRLQPVANFPTSMNPFNSTPSETNLGPLAFSFHKHLVELTEDNHSLYSAWLP